MYTTIIAARAGEPLILEALASITAQTLPPAQVLVVCDRDEVAPTAWVDDMQRVAPTTRVVHSPSTGMVAAINHGIAVSTTPYLAFVDADDLWLPEKQARQVDLLEREPRLEAVSCRAANFRTDDHGHATFEPPQPSIMFTTTTFRREAFERLGTIPPECTHFTWLYRWWGDARQRDIRMATLDYVGTHRRLHRGNSWSLRRQEAHSDLLRELRRRAQGSRIVDATPPTMP